MLLFLLHPFVVNAQSPVVSTYPRSVPLIGIYDIQVGVTEFCKFVGWLHTCQYSSGSEQIKMNFTKVMIEKN
jgi:hypothetical protein